MQLINTLVIIVYNGNQNTRIKITYNLVCISRQGVFLLLL